MVNVISDKPVKTKKCICTKCGYELEFTGEDVTTSSSDGDVYQSIYCPRQSCKEFLSVKWP